MGCAGAGRQAVPGDAGLRKLLQLIFGDIRNVASVAAALLAAYGLSRVAPAAAGALLVLILLAAAAVQAF